MTGSALRGNRWDLLDGVTPGEPPTVSVIVAHYRQPEQLARTLHALRHQDHPADRLEVIVADDGSPDAPTVGAGVRLVRQRDEGFRLAAARNLGASRATGDVLVFLDADTAPEPEFVRHLTRLPALASDVVTVGRRRHADLAGVAPTLPLADAVRGRELTDPGWLTDAYRRTRDLLEADDRSYRYLIGAVLCCSRDFFDEVGGFDTSFTAYGGEDWEWGYRAWLHGAVLAHVPAAVAWHDGPDAAEREASSLGTKNAEALRLADLIPVAGSRGRGAPPARVDVAVSSPPAATAGQAFVSLDSTLASLRDAAIAAESAGDADPRFDRVRVRVELLRPLRVDGDDIARAVERVGKDDLGAVVVTDDGGEDLARITAARAAARHARWGRADLFRTERVVGAGVVELRDEVDVEAYVGGWARPSREDGRDRS